VAKDAAYRQAEKKIEEAKRDKEKVLNLGAMRLTELPDSLEQLTQLQSLNLNFNQLAELPEWLENLSQLQMLALSHNPLRTLPQWLGKLTNLHELYLYGIQLTKFPESLNQFTRLQIWLDQEPLYQRMPDYLTLYISEHLKTTLLDQLALFTQLEELILSHNNLTIFPEALGQFTRLQWLDLSDNKLNTFPESLGQLTHLQRLNLSNNKLISLPKSLGRLTQLQWLNLSNNKLTALPGSLGECIQLQSLDLSNNEFTDLDPFLAQNKHLEELKLEYNPLNPELATAYKQGTDSVKAYLRAKATAQIILNEAKLILVGEGEVGKTCLMDALLGNPWQEHDTTHGIEIQQVKVTDLKRGKEITLNGWDFGGQRVYRPTHQLFFSAPAVYLVVWKPREGPQQGFVKEWIQLIKRREPSAKILVVATHGGPQQRQPDIDRQELWDLFGKETVEEFFHIESNPNVKGGRYGINELKAAIARVAATLPEVGRSVPKSFADVRAALGATGAPYLPLDEVLAICRTHNMDDEIARLFITISHSLGHLTHYENDPALRDIVILRPDWLATAMSYVLDDEETRKAHGLVNFARLGQLWDDPKRPADTRYPDSLHRIFLRLMERFDLSYRVAGLSKDENANPVSLIAQLVPDTTPKAEDFNKAWTPELAPGDIQQTQICRIVDAGNGQSATAEGLFYQLIVRLHRYSLGRVHYPESVHWQRGLVLDADYNGRALLRHIGNDVHITVRAAYPQGFLNTLTDEVKYLVESFWEGLRCDVTVPCLATPDCKGLFEVSKLIENKKRGRAEVPCTICNEWQMVDSLLLNVPAAQPVPAGELLATQQVLSQLSDLRRILIKQHAVEIGRFDSLDAGQKELLSKAETSYNNLIKIFIDEAKEGPRLFSLVPVNRSGFNPEEWTSARFKLILWCEHSRWPLPVLNVKDSDKGVYEFEFTREWFKKVAPVLRTITSTLSIVLPIASSAVKLVMDETAYKAIENELDFGKEVINGVLSGTEKTEAFVDAGDSVDLPHGISIRAENAALRELHTLLKAKDPGFGGLVRVLNKRNEFLWVHERFAGEY
jgi:GTPase SAR1 family protein